jgi:hypothetical protein
MSSSSLNHDILTWQAEAHRLKFEYCEAYSIHTQILHESSVSQASHKQGVATLNVAQIEMQIDAPKQKVQKNIDMANLLLVNMGPRIGAKCVQADLMLREGETSDAHMLLCRTFKLMWGRASQVVTHFLEVLADVTRWNGFYGISTWPTVFLVHSLKLRENLSIHKALQFIGDLFLAQDDENTAATLFAVALEGFTHMDVH